MSEVSCEPDVSQILASKDDSVATSKAPEKEKEKAKQIEPNSIPEKEKEINKTMGELTIRKISRY